MMSLPTSTEPSQVASRATWTAPTPTAPRPSASSPTTARPTTTRAQLLKGKTRPKMAIVDYQKYLDLGGGVRYGDQAEVQQIIRDLKKDRCDCRQCCNLL